MFAIADAGLLVRHEEHLLGVRRRGAGITAVDSLVLLLPHFAHPPPNGALEPKVVAAPVLDAHHPTDGRGHIRPKRSHPAQGAGVRVQGDTHLPAWAMTLTGQSTFDRDSRC